MQNDITAADREAIRAKLRAFGATQQQAAEACFVSKPTVSLWLKGQISSPALDKAIPAFARGLEIGASNHRSSTEAATEAA